VPQDFDSQKFHTGGIADVMQCRRLWKKQRQKLNIFTHSFVKGTHEKNPSHICIDVDTYASGLPARGPAVHCLGGMPAAPSHCVLMCLPQTPSQFGSGDGLDHSNPCGTGLPAFDVDKSGEGL